LKLRELRVYIGFYLSYLIELVFKDTKDCDDLFIDNTGFIFLLCFKEFFKFTFIYFNYSFFVKIIPSFFSFYSNDLFIVVFVKYFYFNFFLFSFFIFYELLSLFLLLLGNLFIDRTFFYVIF
jgi:hypothetical protein